MTSIELRNNFHLLIDRLKNEDLLLQFYELILKKSEEENGLLWKRLSATEQDELLLSDLESEDDKNLIPHNIIKQKHQKWL